MHLHLCVTPPPPQLQHCPSLLTCIHIDVDVSGVDDDADEGGVVVVAAPTEKLGPGVHGGRQTQTRNGTPTVTETRTLSLTVTRTTLI